MLNHHPNYCKCSLCGNVHCDVLSFKQGYICRSCLDYLKNGYRSSVRL